MPFARKPQGWPIELHVGLLILFAMCMVGLWMVPVLFTGLPLAVPELSLGKVFLETGELPLTASRLMPVFVAFFAQCIPWLDFPKWSLLAGVAFAASLLPWWGSIALLMDRRVAWVSTVILAMMPIYWLQAMILTYYSFAFFFLFLAFFLFIALQPLSRTAALLASGVSFGLCIAVKDTFIIFLPWFVLAYLWVHRRTWAKAIGHIILFGCALFAFFALPVAPQVLMSDAPTPQKILSLLPIDRSKPSWDHFYPDQYTYEFDRELFDAQALENDAHRGLLDRLQNEHRLVSFGLVSSLRSLRNGAWFTIGTIPDYFLQDYVGGVFLWLFILPGAMALYKRDKRLLFLMVGLSLSMTFIVRFLLHFERSHLMNDGWILAMLGGIGVCALADTFAKSWKKTTATSIVVIATLCISLQLLQANRVQLARMYGKTRIPEYLAITGAMAQAPDAAIIAVPNGIGFAPLVDRHVQVFRPETIERLLQSKGITKAFAYYGVTHTLGYDDALTKRIAAASPKTQILTAAVDQEEKIVVTPAMEFLLHIFR